MNFFQDFKNQDIVEVTPTLFSQNNVSGLTGVVETARADPQPVVLLIDDIAVERECLTRALKAQCPDFQVLAYTSKCENRFDLRPDIVLIGFPSCDVLSGDASRVIRSIQTTLPDVPVVALVEDADSISVSSRLVDMGVSSYLSHSVGIEGLQKVLWLVLHGGACFPRACIHHTRPAPEPEITAPQVPAPAPHSAENTVSEPGLTQRECDVVRHLRKGKPNKIIAYELGISISTVKVHVRNIMRKTGATNRVEAALTPSGSFGLSEAPMAT
jgi:DNA-binding NarL/FixJ family response regulator